MITNLELLRNFDRFLKASPFNYRVQGVGKELYHYGIKQADNSSCLNYPEVSDYSEEELNNIPLDILRAIAEEVQVLEAGRALYQLIEIVFRQRSPVLPTAIRLMTQAFESESDQAQLKTQLTYNVGDAVLWLGFNGLPFRVTGMFENIPIQLEIAYTSNCNSNERWGELTQVRCHGERIEPEIQPSNSFKLRLVHFLWNEAARDGFVYKRGTYSAPPWTQQPVYTAPAKKSIFRTLLKEKFVKYERERQIHYRENGSNFHYASTAAEFRAIYPNYQTIVSAGVEPEPPSVEKLSAIKLIKPEKMGERELRLIWSFNNTKRHPAVRHLWRLHAAECDLFENERVRI